LDSSYPSRVVVFVWSLTGFRTCAPVHSGVVRRVNGRARSGCESERIDIPGADGHAMAYAVIGQPCGSGAWMTCRLSHPTARCRQAVGRGPLIRLPEAAIGVRRLSAAAQAAPGALRGLCCSRADVLGVLDAHRALAFTIAVSSAMLPMVMHSVTIQTITPSGARKPKLIKTSARNTALTTK
jgi:hypothetical protein